MFVAFSPPVSESARSGGAGSLELNARGIPQRLLPLCA